MFQAFSVTPTASSLYHTSTNGKLIPQRQHSGSLSPKTPFICTEIFLTPIHRSQLILFWPQCSVSRTYLALAVSVCPAPYHHHPAPNALSGTFSIWLSLCAVQDSVPPLSTSPHSSLIISVPYFKLLSNLIGLTSSHFHVCVLMVGLSHWSVCPMQAGPLPGPL